MKHLRTVAVGVFAASAIGALAMPAAANATPGHGWNCRGYAANGAYATAHIAPWQARSNAGAAMWFHQQTGARHVICRNV